MNDYFANTQALRVIDVWKEGNETGWVTPPELYDPALGHVFKKGKTIAFFDHGTVGKNTLMFWCTRGSIRSGEYTLAKYLVPHDTTEYADGKVHDTRDVIFKMIPDWACCNHTGKCVGPFNNTNSIGVEYESLQNGTHDISDMAYIKGALIFAYEAVNNKIKDYFRVAHGLVAIEPWGRRTDPWAGLFDIARSWAIVQDIRADKRIWDLWGLPQPKRGF